MGNQGRSASGQHRRAALRLVRAGAAPAFALALALAAAAVPAAPPAVPTPARPLAAVGPDPIPVRHFRQSLRASGRFNDANGNMPRTMRELADEALENLVTDRLLIQEANRRGIAADEAEVEKRIEALRKSYAGSENWAEIEPQLPVIAEKLRTDFQIEALKAEVTRVAAPAGAELEAFHAANLELFPEPGARALAPGPARPPPSARHPESTGWWSRGKPRETGWQRQMPVGTSDRS